ncbi:MAG: DUF488 family protein [Candidatus Bipolaricaulaceae bacterium]
MALRQTYLSMKKRLPPDAEAVLVMRGRGNDELAPSKELLEEFTKLKGEYTPDSGYPSAVHYAWDKRGYEARFLAQIRGSEAAMKRLAELAQRAKRKDVFLICYEGEDKPCHRKLLLRIAEEELGAEVDLSPFRP